MAESRSYVDFDAAWAEYVLDGFTLPIPPDPGSEFEGDEVPMPATMPAGFKLHMYRVQLERGDDADLSYAELATAAAFLFGPDRLRAWEAQRISEGHLTTAIQFATAEYKAREPERPRDGDGSGKAAPPSSEAQRT